MDSGVSHNPLHPLHQQAEAEFQAYGDEEIVSTFGEPQAEYAAIRKACGMIDLPQRGILELTGKDRLPFLNNLLTNQTFDKQTKTPLPAGRGVYAFLLNAKTGRIAVDLNVIELGDRSWLETDARLIDSLKAQLDRYLFAEQVKFESKVGALHEIALHGPGAADALAVVASSPLTLNASHDNGVTKIIGQDAVVWRDDPTGTPGYHLVFPTEFAAAIWSHLLNSTRVGETLGKRLIRPIGWAAFNTTRIEAGRPFFGIDYDDTILPAETGQLKRAVSFTKGCYPGQEIVARMNARAQVAKQIVGIRMEGDALPIAGAPCQDDAGNGVGGVMSSTISPILSNAALCLALVKKPFFKLGTVLNIPAEGQMRKGAVVETPFIKNDQGPNPNAQ